MSTRMRQASIDVAVESRVPQRLVSRDHVRTLVRAALRHRRVAKAMVSVAFIDAREMARLHRRHLGKTGPTDVITFAFAPVARGAPLVADIYIAPAVARENAARYGVAAREELQRLVVHGALHAAGMHHPEDGDRTRSAMWRAQERILRAAARGKS